MKLGIVGLPNVGKSSLFNAITNAGAASANYPFCTIEPNIGVAIVPDKRIDALCEIYHPAKTTYATIDFVDIAGLVKGASQGEGLGNKFLSHIREVDAIVHVVRCFEDKNIVHVEDGIDPARDIEIINLELIFSDLEVIDKRLERLKKNLRAGSKESEIEVHALTKIKETLDVGKLASTTELDDEEKSLISQINLITMKPVIYVANISENDYANVDGNKYANQVKTFAKQNDSEFMTISAKIEEEIGGLEPDEKRMFLEELGLHESGLDRLIKASYGLLNLISYLTAGTPEVRAWTIKNGTKAPQAAGKIHTDFERGFIRAEVVGFDEFMECRDLALARSKGLIRSEGKDYVMKDGDIVHFLFNV